MNHDNNDIKRGICGEIHADPFHVRGGERLPRNIGKPNQTTASPLCQLHDPTIHHLWTKADAQINIGTTTPINAKSVQLTRATRFCCDCICLYSSELLHILKVNSISI